jgi:hypothetical protein
VMTRGMTRARIDHRRAQPGWICRMIVATSRDDA